MFTKEVKQLLRRVKPLKSLESLISCCVKQVATATRTPQNKRFNVMSKTIALCVRFKFWFPTSRGSFPGVRTPGKEPLLAGKNFGTFLYRPLQNNNVK